TTVENAFRNAVAILRRAGKRATLAVGARRPLKRPLAVARDTHGESGLGYAELPPAGVILDFVKSLDRLLAEQPEPVTLVTLGPVTGLALALRSDPDLVRAKVARHIAMIGNVGAKGNTTRYSEFNAWCWPSTRRRGCSTPERRRRVGSMMRSASTSSSTSSRKGWTAAS
ncbi:MAG: hypothetical protein DMD42_12835, partial [Gemmatimonadetes bacterium]